MVKSSFVRVARNPRGGKKGKPRGSKKQRAVTRGKRKQHKARSKKRASANPASLMTLGFTNGKAGAMAQTKGHKKKKSHAKAFNPSRHRKGGGGKKSHNPRGHRRRSRRNPGLLAGGANLLKSGFYALLGLVATRQLPQMVLGARNTGWVGYISNGVTALIAAAIANRTLGPTAGGPVLIGGGLYVVNRVFQEQFSPVGKVLSLSGLGDAMALSGIEPGYFPLPVPTDAAGMPIIPSQIRALPAPSAVIPAGAVNAKMAGAGNGLGMASTRFVSRF